MRLAPVLSLVLAGLLAGPVLAQPSPSPTDAALAARLAHDAEIADQDRRSEALNAQVNANNRAIEARNAATRAAFEKAMAGYKAALDQHEAQVKAMEADAARAQAAYQAQMEAWKAAVAACKAGDVSKCQPPGGAKPAAP